MDDAAGGGDEGAVDGGFGEVAVLMNNAGVIAGAGPWSDPSAWRRQLEVNLLSIVTAQSIFVPRMLAQGGRDPVVAPAVQRLRWDPGAGLTIT